MNIKTKVKEADKEREGADPMMYISAGSLEQSQSSISRFSVGSLPATFQVPIVTLPIEKERALILEEPQTPEHDQAGERKQETQFMPKPHFLCVYVLNTQSFRLSSPVPELRATLHIHA